MSREVDMESRFIKTHGILTLKKLQAIHDRRKSINQKIGHGVIKLDELLRQINIELDIFKSCQHKISQLFINKSNGDRKNEVLKIISNRINEMYKYLFTLFTVDNNHLNSYIEFCSRNDLLIPCSKLLSTLVMQKQNDPELYLIAAELEFNKLNNIEQARLYYEKGIHEHSQSKELRLNEYRMEIQHLHRIKHNNFFKWHEKYLAAIYDFKNDINLHIELLDASLILQFDGLNSLIVSDLIHFYKDNELLWHKLARMQLNGYSYNHLTRYLSFTGESMAVQKCINIYEEAFKNTELKINQHRLRELYWNTVVEICNSDRMQSEYNKRYMHKTLERSIQEANSSGTSHNPEIWLWAKNCDLNDRRKILSEAVKDLSSSVVLWTELLNLYIAENSINISNIFLQGVNVLKDNSLPLWEITISHTKKMHSDRVDKLYDQGSRADYNVVALEMRPAYLDWCSANRGILAARGLFEELKSLTPPCQKLYTTMIRLEKENDGNNVRRIRKLYNDTCNKFGQNEIWMECIRFEYTQNELYLMEHVFAASLVYLKSDNIHINTMKSWYNNFKNEHKDAFTDEDLILVCSD
ncbi:uncharacterized protein LOC126844489 isoform X2 [Adelges cooleyi]|uniref:uncharacterized protein LOC126844489 isoform X2 n=1 Tax=Adelges cooleyi TaxID=133065 RepID=UPI0021806AA3|nr:uncharacterized protein LOC126844489 isoform X2 [Adelges cooleyi]